jgi:type II secretory pathway component PulF
MVMEEFERAAIQVGEHSGALPGVLDRLADFLEERRRLHDRIQTAMIYPSLVLTVALLLAVVMLGVMIPRFARLFADSRIALPWITRWMLQSGQTLMLVLVLLPVLGFGVGLVLRRYAGRDPEWALRLNRILFRLPLVKRGYTALVNLRFTRTLALLLEGGVSLVDAVPMAGRATGSAWVNRLVARQADEVRHGRSLAEAIRGVPPLAGSLPGWIQAGEAGGDLPNMLEQAARRYEREWNRVIERSMELLEPLLIIVIGTLVLLLALSVLLPVLSLNQTLL